MITSNSTASPTATQNAANEISIAASMVSGLLENALSSVFDQFASAADQQRSLETTLTACQRYNADVVEINKRLLARQFSEATAEGSTPARPIQLDEALNRIDDVLMLMRALHWAAVQAQSHDDLDNVQGLIQQSIPSAYRSLDDATQYLGRRIRTGCFAQEVPA